MRGDGDLRSGSGWRRGMNSRGVGRILKERFLVDFKREVSS